MNKNVETATQSATNANSMVGNTVAVGGLSAFFFLYGPFNGFGWTVSLSVSGILLIIAVPMGIAAYKDCQKQQ